MLWEIENLFIIKTLIDLTVQKINHNYILC